MKRSPSEAELEQQIEHARARVKQLKRELKDKQRHNRLKRSEEVTLPVLLELMSNTQNWTPEGQIGGFGRSACHLEAGADLVEDNSDFWCKMTDGEDTDPMYSDYFSFETNGLWGTIILCDACLATMKDEYGFLDAIKWWIDEMLAESWETQTVLLDTSHMTK